MGLSALHCRLADSGGCPASKRAATSLSPPSVSHSSSVLFRRGTVGPTCVKCSSSHSQQETDEIIITLYLTQHIKISFQYVINTNITEIFIYLFIFGVKSSKSCVNLPLPHISVWTGHTCSAQWPQAPNGFHVGQRSPGTEAGQMTWACKLKLRWQ